MERWKTVEFDQLMSRFEERIREVSGLRQNKATLHVGDDKRGETLSNLAYTALVELSYTVHQVSHFVEEQNGGYDAPSYPAHWSYSMEVSW